MSHRSGPTRAGSRGPVSRLRHRAAAVLRARARSRAAAVVVAAHPVAAHLPLGCSLGTPSPEPDAPDPGWTPGG